MRTGQNVAAIGPRKIVVKFARVLSYLVLVYLIAVEIILVLGFFLLLFGANPTAEFTQWAYRNLDRVMEPFRGIFTPIQLGTTSGDVEAVFDTSVVFAMIIYGIVAMLMSWVTSWLSTRLWYLEGAEAEAERRQQEADRYAAAQAAGAPTVTPMTTPPPPGSPPPPQY